ncbi:permease protein of sugar ABC transporter [marine actinobacterium PHSC20C1]|nr:permease protein of sugar ABC transporter [marine actinobacterium PHSC20C1]
MSEQYVSTTEKASRGVRQRLAETDQPLFLYGAFLLLIIGFTVANPLFLTAGNLLNILNQTALVTIMAAGVALVIITGEIDLSVGSVLALSGVSAALFMNNFGQNWFLGALVGILVGASVGFINGILTARLLIPSFLVTLGMLSIARGIALIMTGTAPVLVTNATFWSVFAETPFLGIPAPIVWTIVVIIIVWVLLHFSVFGRRIFATGGNLDAAKFSGINTRAVKISVFLISGALAGLAGVIVAARGHAIRPDAAAGIELDVLAAVILGGTSLFGGKGKIYGVILGSLIIGILNNGLVLMGIDPSIQLTIKGALVIIAVAFGRR